MLNDSDGSDASDANNDLNSNMQQEEDLPNTTTTVKEHLPFPKDGLTLREMNAFMDQYNLKNSILTTTEVCQQCLLPATAGESSSYCDMLKKRGCNGVGIATVFISHAWKYRFVDVMNALEYHFHDTPEIFIWFDLFANNQHAAGNLPFEWWATTFKSAIAQFGRVVMVLSPWYDPIPFTRAWCLFEVYSAVSTNSKFEIAMSKSDFKTFMTSIQSDSGSFLKMLGTIDLLKCEAFNPADKDRIFEVVKSEVGFSTLNGMVKGKMRDWVNTTLSTRINMVDINMTMEAFSEKKAYARMLQDTGEYERALEIYQECLNGYINLGINPEELSKVYNGIGNVYESLGKYDEAMDYQKKALDMRIDAYGEQHAIVASSYTDIGNIYKLSGKYDEAMEYYTKAIDIYIKCFGDRHIDVASLHNNIGNLAYSLGKYEEALEHHKNAISIKIECLGERHVDVASSYTNIGNVYYSLGKYEEAIEYQRKGLDIVIECLGERHITVASSHTNIASVFYSLGQYEEAMEYDKKSLDIRIECLGARHVHVGDSYNNIGSNCQSLGRYEEAMEYYTKAVDIKIECVGERHDTVADSYYNIGTICKFLGKYLQAMEYHQKALDIRIECQGEGHVVIATSYNEIGSVYQLLGRYNEAMEYHKKALAIKIGCLGDRHVDLAESYNNIASVCQSLGMYEEAMEFYKKALDISTECLGECHSDLIVSYIYIADLFTQMENYVKCEDMLKQALDIVMDNSVMLTYIHFVYAEMFRNEGNNPSEATRYYQLCLEARKDLYGSESNHIEIAECLYGLGMICVSVGSYDEAFSYLSQCLNMRLLILPDKHPDVARSYYGLGVMYCRQGNMLNEARDNLTKALDMQMSLLGEHHKHTKETMKALNSCSE
jgi:tetratricopeptide (TPR) repeat protein